MLIFHTWNAVDGHDGNESYDRGIYWYAKEFDTLEQPLGNGRLYLEILAAGQQVRVFVNGKEAIYHEGGYSTFRADITELCKKDGEKNLLLLNCSNEYKDSVYPQSADFTFYGGLYRGVNLISISNTCFSLEYFGGLGVYVTPEVCEGGATFKIQSYVKNPGEDYTVLYSIKDREGNEVAGGCRPSQEPEFSLFVPDAKLWQIDDPYLYTVDALLVRRNETCDEVSVKTGIRSFSCDPDQGFILNNVPTPLRGVNHHQNLL